MSPPSSSSSRRAFCASRRSFRFVPATAASAWRCRIRPMAPRSERRKSSAAAPSGSSLRPSTTSSRFSSGGSTSAWPMPWTLRSRNAGPATTISTACAIWRAGRPWFGPSTICSSAPWSCERATSTSSHSGPGLWCECGSTGFCAPCRFPAMRRRRPSCRVSRSWPASTSPNAGCLRMARRARGSDAPRSISASRPCRRSTARAW